MVYGIGFTTLPELFEKQKLILNYLCILYIYILYMYIHKPHIITDTCLSVHFYGNGYVAVYHRVIKKIMIFISYFYQL